MYRFVHHLPLKDTMVFEEECFKSPLRASLAEKKALFNSTMSGIWMFKDNDLIGETYMQYSQYMNEDLEGVAELNLPLSYLSIGYIYSTAIRPEWQGKGLSKILKAYSLGYWKNEDVEVIIGHAKEGASLGLNKIFGAVIYKKCENWFETGENYYLYKIEL